MYLFFYPHNWMAFVRLNKRHVMLRYVILTTNRQHTVDKIVVHLKITTFSCIQLDN